MEIGEKINDWTVLSLLEEKGKILCKCKCGVEKSVNKKNLQNNLTKSCGCRGRKLGGETYKLEVGTRYGKLTVIEEAVSLQRKHGKSKRGTSSLYYYNCLCDCGNTKMVVKAHLKSGATTSCGCTELGIKKYKNIPRWLIRNFKGGAKARNKEWNLDITYLGDLWEKQHGKCAYTGWDLEIGVNGHIKTASLDRIDSNRGYIQGNVQWVHKVVNYAKHTLTHEEFLKMCFDISSKVND